MNELLNDAARRSAHYLESLKDRQVAPTPEAVERLSQLFGPLQEDSLDPATVLDELDQLGSPATVASAGGRYFGFVIGGSLPAALASSYLAAAWDQNAGSEVMSPIASVLEKVCREWLLTLLGMPSQAQVGFVTGATMANFVGLAAARHSVLEDQGWDVEADGLFGAPPIQVIVGEEVHESVLKALRMLGLGGERVVRVPVDDQGRMIPGEIPEGRPPSIVCIQAGNVNTGAFDPAEEICLKAKDVGAWVHTDGAFGLWAAASPGKADLMAGYDQADSWSTDAHKWLNVPYDSGIVFVRNPEHLNAAMAASAAYLIEGDTRDPYLYVPEMSRRARAVEVWAALRSLGRSGLTDLIDRTCDHASRMAEGLTRAGFEVLNEVSLNQILVSFGSPELTRRVIAEVQSDGTCWCGGTEWQGQVAMRISVSSWSTTREDISRSLEAIIRIASKTQTHA